MLDPLASPTQPFIRVSHLCWQRDTLLIPIEF